ncbi:YibE/F family protein [Actinomadura sp. KC345]|uniref:YibE/F family protein n=1 Tax=Actinomadura sp. KC345 TaxID=2530371 RepID=UPI00104BD3BF|nr:YibE/F family protein [Actinomadura sp. KC345]TDC58753.1 YibE/F family protein [Actinomadura sp. KC345]
MGAFHSHESGGGSASQRTVRVMLVVIVLLAVVTIAALAWMWPSGSDASQGASAQQARETGTVLRINLKPCPKQVVPEAAPEGQAAGRAPTDPRRCGEAVVQLTSGPQDGRAVRTELPSGPGDRVFEAGDEVVLVSLPGVGEGPAYQLSDHDRSTALWVVAAAFVLAVVAFGRWRGLTALVGLAVTFALLVLFLIPAIIEGSPPMPVAIVCASAIMLAVLYLTHGISVATSVAVMGTLGCLTLTGVLAAVAIDLTRLTGIIDDNSLFLDMDYGINTQGLLLASIIIGSLGVLDDVTVTQSMTVQELARANPSYSFMQVYRAAARVGRSHIASVINTIVLAYAGASLPLLLLFSIGGRSAGEVLTNPAVAQEIVRSVAGTLGLIAAVPLTTALAALAAVHQGPGARDASSPTEARPSPDAAGVQAESI